VRRRNGTRRTGRTPNRRRGHCGACEEYWSPVIGRGGGILAPAPPAGASLVAARRPSMPWRCGDDEISSRPTRLDNYAPRTVTFPCTYAMMPLARFSVMRIRYEPAGSDFHVRRCIAGSFSPSGVQDRTASLSHVRPCKNAPQVIRVVHSLHWKRSGVLCSKTISDAGAGPTQ
jgi:hypothetical protein